MSLFLRTSRMIGTTRSSSSSTARADPGLGRFASYVEDVRSGRNQFEGLGERPVIVVEPASIRKGVRGNVENAHDERAPAEFDDPVPEFYSIEFTIRYGQASFSFPQKDRRSQMGISRRLRL